MTANANYQSTIACGSFGKRSNIDIGWGRPFTSNLKNSLNNYVGVKYHVEGDFRGDTIFLHLFDKGYAGLVKVEANRYNFCYLTAADNLKKSNNSMSTMEVNILGKNPLIRELLARATKLDPRPVTISQISFESKSNVENHVLMLGDAAGMITPLCGNGMSMALHSSKIAAELICLHLDGRISANELKQRYCATWQRNFKKRIKMGRLMQYSLSIPSLATMLMGMGRMSPLLVNQLIRRTHGEPF